ncbi:hypothetical protein Tco_0836800 [Tanacetum coccineum]
MASTTEHKGAVEDEDTGAHIAPIVKLGEVAVTTGVESRVLIPDTTFVGVESRVLIPETTAWDTLVYPSDTLVIRKQKLE